LSKEKQKKFGKPKSFSNYSDSKIDPLQKTSLLSRIFGNQKKLDDARKTFFTAYKFESNINPLRIITLLLLLSVILGLGMFFIERNNERIYKSWKYQGISSIPPSNISNFDQVIDFSKKEQLSNCDSWDPNKLLEGECDKPISYVNEMNETQSRSQILYIFQFLLMFLLFFPLGTFFHRSLRNIKTLRYETSVSPEKSIVWIYFSVFLYFLAVFISKFISKDFTVSFSIVFLSFFFLSYRLYKTFIEIYKGSLIEKSNRLFFIFTNKFKIWFISYLSILFFNPSIITRFWAYELNNIDDLITATKLMNYSSIVIIIFCFFSIVLVAEIYKLQEIKNIKVGSITVDPLQ
tara:strand:+ start:11994 stop:13037 length:1044 start_codon:yes stop_codon:yes gene_type:complete